ncbi:hypothetical protein Godav_023890, partial [Gossypium davidsonii]|nr:hypothetical protein [Gossypium davidsonii]
DRNKNQPTGEKASGLTLSNVPRDSENLKSRGHMHRIPNKSTPKTDSNQKNMEAFQSWVSEHKLTSIGAVWASAIGASLAYNSRGKSPLKPSLRLIHARMHSQALTLAVLSGAAAYHYYEKSTSNQEKVTNA